MIQIEDGPLLPAAVDVRVFDERSSWADDRLASLGSSDMSAILGLNGERSGWDVYAKRVLGQRALSRATEKLFARGHREEPRILEDYEIESGDRVLRVSNVIVEGPRPIAVSVDSFIKSQAMGNAWGCGEIKSDRSPFRWGRGGVVIESWTTAARSIIREDYAAQCYSQMIATGLPYTILVVRRDMDDLRWYYILADERLQERMLERCVEWWDRHIVQGIRPEPDGSRACADALARIFGAGKERAKKKRPARGEEIKMARDCYQASQEAERAKKRADELRTRLAMSIGEAYGIEWAGPGGISSALYIDKTGRSTIDVDKLKLLYPDAYNAVLRVGEPTREIKLYMQEK